MKCNLPVLVVEDSFLIAASLEHALLDAGHPVTLAAESTNAATPDAFSERQQRLPLHQERKRRQSLEAVEEA